jgi:flavin reductase (DIM6/NTAB) family NADH-FMN oxidoreductase RutF
VLLQLLEFFARLKTHCLAWRNGNFCAGAGIASDTRLAGTHVEYSEPAELNTLPTRQCVLHTFEDRLYGHFGLCFRYARSIHHFIYDIELDQDVLQDGLARLRTPGNGTKYMIGLSLDDCQGLIMRRGVAVDSDLFRRACSRYATGIAIATVTGDDATPYGLTVNSFTSVSCCPPLVLICVDYRSSLLPHFRATPYYGINVLADSQRSLSVRFSQRQPDRFEGLQWELSEHGVPLLADCLACLECAISQTVEAGDHAIFIAEVISATHRDGEPLLYYRSSYRALGA